MRTRYNGMSWGGAFKVLKLYKLDGGYDDAGSGPDTPQSVMDNALKAFDLSTQRGIRNWMLFVAASVYLMQFHYSGWAYKQLNESIQWIQNYKGKGPYSVTASVKFI